MRKKIQNSFNELPPSSHESLRDSLITHIGQITYETESIIVTQLCLAIADLALLMASWKNPIIDMIENLSTRQESVWPLLEILTCIPEELDSRYLRLGANRREEIHKQFEASSPQVLEFLVACLTTYGNSNELILYHTLRCYNAWLAIRVMPLNNITENPVAQQIFCLLSVKETSRKLHNISADCLCTLLHCIESNNRDSNINPTITAQIFNGVIALETGYHSSVVQEDLDKTLNYCRIFTVLCESFFYSMLAENDVPHYSTKGLDLVLMCVGHFDYEVAEITFNLWYRLSEELYRLNNDELAARFKPHIERLLSALYRHAQMESDHDGLIEETDSFNVNT